MSGLLPPIEVMPDAGARALNWLRPAREGIVRL